MHTSLLSPIQEWGEIGDTDGWMGGLLRTLLGGSHVWEVL